MRDARIQPAELERLQAIIPADCYLPILVLTADITQATRRRALEMGAHDFLAKPFDQTAVLLRVRNLLHTRFLHRAQKERHRALADAHLVGVIPWLLERYAVAPRYLILEITESALMLVQERAPAVLCRRAALGVRLSIDDFGTGYASFGYLRRMPLSEVKIDRSFVSAISVSEQDSAIVESVVTLAHNLGLKVVSDWGTQQVLSTYVRRRENAGRLERA